MKTFLVWITSPAVGDALAAIRGGLAVGAFVFLAAIAVWGRL